MLLLLKGEVFERVIPVYGDPEERRQPPTPRPVAADKATPLFTVRPNPAADHLTVVFPSWQAGEELAVKICSPTGQTVLYQSLPATYSDLEIGRLPAGLYLVTLLQNGRVLASQKLVKQ